jgi:2-methylcitrate dehydratase PrpD
MTLIDRAADHLASLRRQEPTDAVLHAVKLCLADFLGCCSVGSRLPIGDAMRSFARHRDGAAQAYHYAAGRKLPAPVAAFGNATLGHSLIREDMHVASGSHIGVLVIPAVLALVERDGLSGRDLVTGIVAGYEVASLLGTAVWSSGTHTRHFRPSGITGSFGAAGATATAAGADRETTVHALALAANFAGGLNEWAWSGSEEIFVHAGMAAQNGLTAYDLAVSGVRGSPRALEGRDGLFAAFGAGEKGAAIFAQLLDVTGPPAILGVEHKPVAGCNLIQTPIAAAIKLHAELPDPQAIERIVLHTFTEAQRFPGCDHAGPFDSVQQTKMSLQFGVCAALVHGHVDEIIYRQFDDAVMNDLRHRFEIVIDPEMNAAFPERQPVRLDVMTRDGATISSGFDDVPWLDAAAVLDRFGAEMPSMAAADRILASIDNLIGAPDCDGLFNAIAAAERGLQPA